MLIWLSSPLTLYNKFIFLDRDGVVNQNRPDYIKRWSEFKFFPDSLDALRWLRENGINVILISNQSALNRGLISWEDFWELHHMMISAISQSGGQILAAFYCPHRPDENCACRKPSPQMIQLAAEIYQIRLEEAPMIGDSQTDLTAAARAGCRGILLEREGGEDLDRTPAAQENISTFKTLSEAVRAVGWNT